MLIWEPLVCVTTTRRHSDWPAAITRAPWLALVLTESGLVVLGVPAPNVVVQVVPPFGMVAIKPAQPAAAVSALTLTLPVSVAPPAQSIANDHTPALIV